MKLISKLLGNNLNIKNINHVAIVVSDMDIALEFYVKVLGLTILQDGRNGGGEKKTFLGTKSKVLVALSENIKRKSKDENNIEGVNHIAFEVQNLDKSSELLKDRGVHFTEVKLDRNGKPTAYHFLDPDGFELEICADTDNEIPQY